MSTVHIQRCPDCGQIFGESLDEHQQKRCSGRLKIRVSIVCHNTKGALTLEFDKGRATIHGLDIPFINLTAIDLTTKVKETEQYLSKITGLTITIEPVRLSR